MTPTTETWLPIPGWEGYYEVSDHGRVRSLDHVTIASDGRRMTFKGRVKKLPINAGRVVVKLYSPERPALQMQVSVLVLKAFVGPRPPGMFGCHNDGDPLNNRLGNLRWDTPAANHQDCIRHGRNPMLNRTHCPRGHRLVAPNIPRYEAARGRRSCLACARARAIGRERQVDVCALADEKYSQIMQEASP